jgi:2-polyprenyl-3-methyl-5-hydroxy-6-metoxy-1,4-benzoquinol methylase
MGVPLEHFEFQVRVLRELRQRRGWVGKLFEPGSGAPDFRWSKDLYEFADQQLLAMIPVATKNVLSVGCGWGETEAQLKRKGIDTCAVPLDAVFGAAAKHRGIRSIDGPFHAAIESLGEERFDVVLLADVLHLVENPVDWLRRLRGVLRPNGKLIASVPNTADFTGRRRVQPACNGNGSGTHKVHKVNVRRLRSWCRSAGLRTIRIEPVSDGSERFLRKWGARALGFMFAPKFILTAKPR